MLKIPQYEILYFREKVNKEKIKLAKKDLPKKREILVLLIVIFAGIVQTIWEDFYLISLIAVAGGIASLFGNNIPSEWALGSRGIYLPWRFISWHEINNSFEVEERKYGFLFRAKKFYKGYIYLITNNKQKVRQIIRNYVVNFFI